MRTSLLCLLGFGVVTGSVAAPPIFHNNARSVQLDGVRLGSDLTPNSLTSLQFSVAYDGATRIHHLWLLRDDAAVYPTSGWALGDITHASGIDGVHFFSDGNLLYGIGSSARSNYGATIEPPVNFLRGVKDAGVWKLLIWSPNDSDFPVSRWGEYNYNTSVNEIGSSPGNRVVTHQGPLRAAAPGGVGPGGQHVGVFGLVDSKLYLRVDSLVGGLRQFSYTDAITPGTSDYTAGDPEADLFAGSPYCWGLPGAGTCNGANPIPAYVHNAGRTLRHYDGRLISYYAFRDWETAARLDKQIWSVDSNDNGATWSSASGVFADGNAVTLDGGEIPSNGRFSSVEASEGSTVCRLYFSTRDANDKPVVATVSTGGACDTLFGDNFDGTL